MQLIEAFGFFCVSNPLVSESNIQKITNSFPLTIFSGNPSFSSSFPFPTFWKREWLYQ